MERPIEEYIIDTFCDRGVAVQLLNAGRYLKLILEANQKTPFSALRNIFETIILLHSVCVMSTLEKHKKAGLRSSTVLEL